MTDDHPLNGNDAVRIRDHIVGAFHGPGIDPPSLNDGEYGWIAQDDDVKPGRVRSVALAIITGSSSPVTSANNF